MRASLSFLRVDSGTNIFASLSFALNIHQGRRELGVFCSRALDMREISTIGYDMDYTLVHYNVDAWEGSAFDYSKQYLLDDNFPVEDFVFDPDLVIRGLVVDKDLGNLVKADRFGYVQRAMHGTTMLESREIKEIYGREPIDLRKTGRWYFLNTLFTVSEAVMFAQMVDTFDAGKLSDELNVYSYTQISEVCAQACYRTHVEGYLKKEIMNEPERFIEEDPLLPLALLDQKDAGKKLLLITNSDYEYTEKMMAYSYNKFLPSGMTWRSLFDVVIVSARKPNFFLSDNPLYEIVTADGLLRPALSAVEGGLFSGGSAKMVERALGVSGDEIMYVGDHIYTDVSISKTQLRWRTCLIIRELEQEIEAIRLGSQSKKELRELIDLQHRLLDLYTQCTLIKQRALVNRPYSDGIAVDERPIEADALLSKLESITEEVENVLDPLLKADGKHFSKRWGYLCRTGLNDKSHLTRQIEKYADIYTSRVSNLLRYSPFTHFKSPSQTLAHDKTN